MRISKMLSGANHYYQGVDILGKVGREAADRGTKKALVLGGKHALDAAWESVKRGLEDSGIEYVLNIYEGFTTEADISALTELYRQKSCNLVIGIGGGKIMDISKAVAAESGAPVFNVATSAATCACFAPLSVIYNNSGMQEKIMFHDNEVDAVFVDLDIISGAPARLLAAGMADAMAKTCEYSTTHPSLQYGDIDTAKYCGYRLAQAVDEILLDCGAEAYQDVKNNKLSNALEDAVFASIAVIGIVSGMCGYTNKPGGRFAIAHGFNEIIRGRWEKDPRRFLHGELVAVGVLAQLYVNQMPNEHIDRVRNFYRSIEVPTTLHELGMDLDDGQLKCFQDEIINNTNIGCTHETIIRYAIEQVR
ncbi:iron-containing alcohol dehydrogenase [Anaerotruncus rubiinfantis]|uniref:iron-containing alcohol dehydrogenase n=1 Tax=Anaerotruncus rubiinfantis TaxID=1720200 RepID=UPI00189703EB|nr:iron-containing alcohol dehydrogenase [Anaerotruncus rubiinfantis]